MPNGPRIPIVGRGEAALRPPTYRETLTKQKEALLKQVNKIDLILHTLENNPEFEEFIKLIQDLGQ